MSVSDEKIARSKELLQRVLPLMSKYAGDFRPSSYAVWYEYAAGQNDDLRRALDPLIASGERVSEEVTFELFNKHLVERTKGRVDKAQADTLQMLARVETSMAAATSETSRFNASLTQFGASLSDPTKREKLDADIAGMIDETSRVGRTIAGLVEEVRVNQAEVARLSAELGRERERADSDPLTGLSNRGSFDQALTRLCAHQAADSSALSLMMLDIDHFKRINDTYGHPFGDQVIKSVAAAIRALVRGRDIAARYGGEEFAVLLPVTELGGAQVLGERVREQIERSRIRRADGEEVGSVTISIGIAERREGEPELSFLGRADRALYLSKTNGRNRVTASP